MNFRELVWRADWPAASQEARKSHKLLFVVFACARPSALATALFEARDPALAVLLRERVVPVRFTSIKDVDLNRFVFDYDLALVGLVMTPDGAVLARWGGEGASLAQLTTLLRRVTPGGRQEPRSPQTVAQKYPIFLQKRAAQQPCYHCHYAYDAELLERQAKGTFVKSFLFRYPPAHCLGLRLDAEARVVQVQPTSPGAKGGVVAGDQLLAANGVPVYTEADLRYALERLADVGSTVGLLLRRQGKTRYTTLTLPRGWRVYDISSRPSQGAIPPVLGFWEEAISGSTTLALKVSFLFPGEKWRPSQGDLRVGDVIVAVDGQHLPPLSPRQFHSWFRLNKQVGETAVFTVLRGGKSLSLPVPCLDLRLD